MDFNDRTSGLRVDTNLDRCVSRCIFCSIVYDIDYDLAEVLVISLNKNTLPRSLAIDSQFHLIYSTESLHFELV